MRLLVAALTAVGLAATSASDVCAQAAFVTAGAGLACKSSDGSGCQQDTRVVVTTIGVHATEQFVIAFRASRLEDQQQHFSVYDSGKPTAARLREETSRTLRIGAEFLFHPPPRTDRRVSGFGGGGGGVRIGRQRTTCASGDCQPGSRFDDQLGESHPWMPSIGFVTGVDVTIAGGIITRGTLRFDDYPSSDGAAQVMFEIGYRFGGSRREGSRRGTR